MPLRECMERVSHQEYLLWMEWLDQEWNKPSRLEYYLMQIAAEIRRVLSKKPSSIKLVHFLLKFKKAGAAPKLTRAQQLALSKAHWFSGLGIPIQETDNVNGS